MNRQVFEVLGITFEEYKDYCKENKIEHYRNSNKREFLRQLLDGELIVIEKGKIIRKLFDYYTTPELNENFGKIEYEDEQEISDWIDIGQYMDYLLSSL